MHVATRLTLLFVAVALWGGLGSRHQAPADAIDITAASGMEAHVDPTTGQLTSPTTSNLNVRHAPRQGTAELPIEASPVSGVMVRLDERFLTGWSATIGRDGAMRAECGGTPARSN